VYACVDSCGKVCLSLLGTWDGQQGEQWNETTSTVLQVSVDHCYLLLTHHLHAGCGQEVPFISVQNADPFDS